MSNIFLELQAQLEKQRRELGQQLQNKVSIFQMYNDKMNKIKEDFLRQTTEEL